MSSKKYYKVSNLLIYFVKIYYSYKLKINDDNNLYFGLALGVINNKIDFSKAVVRDGADPYLFSTAQTKTAFSADFGLGYTYF